MPRPFVSADIGANLLDDRYMKGIYRGQERHAPDIHDVLQRAMDNHVDRIILTAGTIEESRTAGRNGPCLEQTVFRSQSTLWLHRWRSSHAVSTDLC